MINSRAPSVQIMFLVQALIVRCKQTPAMEKFDNDWKLKLRYGKLQTPYKHITVLAVGIAKEIDGFDCPPGNAIMGMKVWASSDEEAVDIIKTIGEQIGFKVTGDIELFYSDPVEPPRENPYGYDINFTPFES